MIKISLRKIRVSDKKYFAKWWRDRELLKLTSGILKPISDQEVEKYFSKMITSKKDYHFMIALGSEIIGHLSLRQRPRDWFETQIVIGEKEHWGKGVGTEVIELLLEKAWRLGIRKIYLEVRPTNTRAIKAYKKCGFVGVKINRSRLLRMELK